MTLRKRRTCNLACSMNFVFFFITNLRIASSARKKMAVQIFAANELLPVTADAVLSVNSKDPIAVD